MRKLCYVLIAFLGFAITTQAQNGAKKPTKAKTEATKTDAKVPLKKDGTPDKRFKENKKPEVVLKKDGTPDKRYKPKKK
jgi:hypothetical protein